MFPRCSRAPPSLGSTDETFWKLLVDHSKVIRFSGICEEEKLSWIICCCLPDPVHCHTNTTIIPTLDLKDKQPVGGAAAGYQTS